MRDRDRGEVVFKPAVGATFVMIETEALLELAVVVLDAPAELREPHERHQRGIGR